jgi:cytochrome c oxidase accessory protein FixG
MNGAKVTAEPVKLEGFAPKDLYQRRERIYTRFVGGFFQRLRFFTGWPLLVGYFAVPWLRWNGEQAVLFDLPARAFRIFETTFFPQDFWLVGWLLIIAALALFLVTTLVGRLWCGYTCPQTVWTAVFMWMEQLAEGPRHMRIRLARAPWSLAKLVKRSTKHGLWLSWATLTGVTFVGYFVPIQDLFAGLWRLQLSPWSGFWILFFSAATYINAGWLREQVCIYMCPYARFQSAMVDKDTLVVSYDTARGEPRGSRKRRAESLNERAQLGDCVDCQLCVQVCPVGIDIRDGLQYQCVGCAQCIDACNQVMQKMDYPSGLVRYATERELLGGKTHWLRPRTAGYATAFLFMFAALTAALITRSTLEVDIARERGNLFQVSADDRIVNQYRLRIHNKGQTKQTYTLQAHSSIPIAIHEYEQLRQQLSSLPGEIIDLALTLTVSKASLHLPKADVRIELCETATGQCDTEKTTFLGLFKQ